MSLVSSKRNRTTFLVILVIENCERKYGFLLYNMRWLMGTTLEWLREVDIRGYCKEITRFGSKQFET